MTKVSIAKLPTSADQQSNTDEQKRDRHEKRLGPDERGEGEGQRNDDENEERREHEIVVLAAESLMESGLAVARQGVAVALEP